MSGYERMPEPAPPLDDFPPDDRPDGVDECEEATALGYMLRDRGDAADMYEDDIDF